MTVLSRQQGLEGHEHTPPRPCRYVAVRWEISRAAIHATRPDLVSAGLNEASLVGASTAPVLLEWRVDLHESGAVAAHASLFDPTCNRIAPLLSTSSSLFAQGQGPTWIEEGLMLHVDIPGLLMLSFRTGDRLDDRKGGLLYARTSVLADLGLPGGRYESATLAHRSAVA